MEFMGSGGGTGSPSSNWNSEWCEKKTPVSRRGGSINFIFSQLTKFLSLILVLKIKASKHMLRETHLRFSVESSPSPCWSPVPVTHYPQYLGEAWVVQETGTSPLLLLSLCCSFFLTQLFPHGHSPFGVVPPPESLLGAATLPWHFSCPADPPAPA